MFTASPQQNNVAGSTFSRAPSLLAEEKKSVAPYIFTAGMFTLALISLGLTAYAYNTKDSLQKQSEAKRAELNSITFSQEGATLQDIEDLSGRLRGVTSIFTGAPSAGSVFTIFENAAERGVSFGKIEMMRVEGSKSYKVTVSGKANTFRDLILQRETLKLAPYSKYVSEVTVANFPRDPQTGIVSFTMTAVISVGRFGIANLLVDLTKPSEALTPSGSAGSGAGRIPPPGPSPTAISRPIVTTPPSLEGQGQASSSPQQATSSASSASSTQNTP